MQSRTNVRPLTFTTDSGAIPMRACAEASTAFSSVLGGWVISSLLRYGACPEVPGFESQGGKLSCDREEPGKLSSNVVQPARDNAKTQRKRLRAVSTRAAGFTVFSLADKYSDRGPFSQTGTAPGVHHGRHPHSSAHTRGKTRSAALPPAHESISGL